MTARAQLLCAPIALALAACGGDPEPAPRAREPATERPPPATEVPPTSATEPGRPAEVDEAPPPVQRTGRPSESWTDASQGVLATLVYVTEKGTRERSKPHVIIIGSDPRNPHFDRSTTRVLTVLRVQRDTMSELLGHLREQGLDGLPWRDRPVDAPIGPERALLLYQGGRLRAVVKDELPEGTAGPRRAFTACERAIIAESMKGAAGESAEGGVQPPR